MWPLGASAACSAWLVIPALVLQATLTALKSRLYEPGRSPYATWMLACTKGLEQDAAHIQTPPILRQRQEKTQDERMSLDPPASLASVRSPIGLRRHVMLREERFRVGSGPRRRNGATSRGYLSDALHSSARRA